VIRSCWNYYENPPAFLDWIERASSCTRLANPPGVVRWNLHKTYLRDLQEAGVPIIPTAWFRRGACVDLETLMKDRGWNDVVVKPAISASSYRTNRFRANQTAEGQAFMEALLRDRDAMVQRYISSVEGTGERAIVWIDGEITHAVRKNPRFADGVESVSAALPVSDRQRDIARLALSCVEGDLLYGRVDVVDDDDGQPMVSEVELMEPSLFLLQNPAALGRFVEAIRRWAAHSTATPATVAQRTRKSIA